MDELLVDAVVSLDEEKALFLAKNALQRGVSKEEIVACVQKGMDGIGRLYENSEYFIADLMMAGILFKEILTLEGMGDDEVGDGSNQGVLMIGTVEGDLHDLGKDIFGGMAEAAGFRVIDLGIDVNVSAFVENVKKYRPDFLGLSAILTHAVKSVKDTIDALEAAGLRDDMKILIGGSAFKKKIPGGVNADALAEDASDGVKICKQWAKEKYAGM